MAKSLGWYRLEQLILKITLSYSQPAIWRRVEVHSGLTLEDFHCVIQNVFEWDDSHLHHFLVAPGGKMSRTALRNAVCYSNLPHDPFFGPDNDEKSAAEIILGRVFTDACKQIIYEYDFGDSWEHIIKLEKRSPGGAPDQIPVCLAGENAAPIDDMGGMGGYYEWVDAWSDKTSEMHEQAREWLGPKFDPAQFDPAAANKRLKLAFKPAPKRPRKPRKKKP